MVRGDDDVRIVETHRDDLREFRLGVNGKQIVGHAVPAVLEAVDPHQDLVRADALDDDVAGDFLVVDAVAKALCIQGDGEKNASDHESDSFRCHCAVPR